MGRDYPWGYRCSQQKHRTHQDAGNSMTVEDNSINQRMRVLIKDCSDFRCIGVGTIYKGYYLDIESWNLDTFRLV